LEGGVPNEFAGYPDRGTNRVEAALGGVDAGGLEVDDFSDFRRGIDEGEKLRAENDMSESNESIDEEEEILG
jgi:hypothetical protein